MQLGMIGLGRMGANLAQRVMRAGHECVVWDRTPDVTRHLEEKGATGASSLEDFVGKLKPTPAAWAMGPSAVVGHLAARLAALVGPGAIPVAGGTSYYRAAIERSRDLAYRGRPYT